MNSEWPREVRRRADAAGVVYDLPVRPPGGLCWMATQLRRALGLSTAKRDEGPP